MISLVTCDQIIIFILVNLTAAAACASKLYRVVPLQLQTDGIPHGGLMVHSVESYVIIVDLQQAIL